MAIHHEHHAHDHAHHGHRSETTHSAHTHHHANTLKWPVLLTVGFAFVEAFSGWLTGSLALLSDATHMFSDAAALLLAWLGVYIARKPATDRHTFGLVRAEVIVAFINGLAMLWLVALIIIEAISRFKHPEHVSGVSVMVVASFGLIVNLIVAKQLHHHAHNLNTRAALIHVMGDILGSVAAILAGAVIYFTDWLLIDPILSCGVALLILRSTWLLLKEALHILMEGVPGNVRLSDVRHALQTIEHVKNVHDLRVWAISSENIAFSGHVVIANWEVWPEVIRSARQCLKQQFGIQEVTLQPELMNTDSHLNSDCWLTNSTVKASHSM